MSSDLDDGELFEKLEEYTAALQSGNRLQCEQLEREFPQILEYRDCLSVLDQFLDNRDESNRATITPDNRGGSADGNGQNSIGSSILQPNSNYGKFVIQKEIGRGGMGVVFHAKQTDLDRDVALKVIRSHRLASEEELRRFQVEAKAAARIQHSNVIAVHEIGEIDGLQYIAMDYIEGETLSEKLSKGPMDVDDAAGLIATIAKAVDYLHSCDVVHRDLKPSNILIDSETEEAYVTDFGLARIYSPDESGQTSTGAILGTPSYMAPEQAAGRNKLLGPATDIYALGAILYEMVCGSPPFQKENPLDTLVQVIETEPMLPRRRRAGLSRRLERIILKCLEKEPERRYETAKELADDLERYLRGETVSAASPHWWERVRRWTRRFPAAASRLGGVVATGTIFEIRHLTVGVNDVGHHQEVMLVLGIWAATITLFQFLTRNPNVARFLEYWWCLSDVIFLTILLVNAQETGDDLGPLVIGYPMIVVASGMFFKVPVVIFTTVLSLIGYGTIWLWHPSEPRVELYGFIFLAVLGILGWVTAYQVHRAKVLGRYYENR